MKKFPQINALHFKYEKLTQYFYDIQLNSMSDRVKEFKKHVSFIKANLSPKYFNINESQHSVIITHPANNWTLSIFYRPEFDAYSHGVIRLSYSFLSKE